MRVDERERRVARERNALSRRAKRDGRAHGRREVEIRSEGEDAIAIDMRLDEIGDSLEPRLERLRLAHLHEAKMALRQRNRVVARQRANDRNSHRLDRLADQPAMALAADAIDDDAHALSAVRHKPRSP